MVLKFRAWNKVNKKMFGVDGFRVLENKIYRCNLADSEFRDGHLETIHYVEDDLKNFILMQSAEIFDKNGIELFEGDVVSNGYSRQIVKFGLFEHEEDYGAKAIFRGFDLLLGGGYPTPVMEEFEVIGNIYENPELLKEVNQ